MADEPRAPNQVPRNVHLSEKEGRGENLLFSVADQYWSSIPKFLQLRRFCVQLRSVELIVVCEHTVNALTEVNWYSDSDRQDCYLNLRLWRCTDLARQVSVDRAE